MARLLYGGFMPQRHALVGALSVVLALLTVPVVAQDGRREAAEAYARVVDYPLLIAEAVAQRAAELPESERVAFTKFVSKEVDSEMTRFYAISAMVDLFNASELQALTSFAKTPEGRSALGKLPLLGALLTPLVARQIADAERRYRNQ